ncbi:uncharacterized protein N7496_000470 [Penicillium cataractarum]|uniref:THO complex subunit Tho1 n=1 Tax=Penicillium cataractarum TaxID=2100454 RepID=A0A9W9VU38_9EURO|nr:uncharacterized protein N7496_000470 [Penicillium cataractarum]KAJ5389402.1 hypothetical protein N7496_000470 [Penicillium cataractarum]
MAATELEAVRLYKEVVDRLLERAAEVKPDSHIEPPLTEGTLGEPIWQVPVEKQDIIKGLNLQTQFAAVEIAFREKFYRILASTSIQDPSFIHIWNLLDIVSIFSDNEQCEPGLIFWLIEELLDSQTIDGCRKVFDYLESRRERNIKKHFKQKSLVILRSCNELLRRLSRAEDTVFCGRVFIFLFQSFPLGDKSSVNLRGEFHTENVTTYDDVSRASAQNDEDTIMADGNEGDSPTEVPTDGTMQPEGSSQVPKVVVTADKTTKGRKGDNKKENVDLDALYPVFWSLQAYFSAPSKMFDSPRFADFKAGLDATLSAFKNINTELENPSGSRSSDEARKTHKRKRVTDDAEIGTSFNPKYLTSRDLFDLEVSDTAFRRHVLVQALILIDFMLSLAPNAKARLADATNKSVLYGFVLNEEHAKWATDMRKSIEGYLRQGDGGNFYFRMVDTVLSRDKNWVRWKAEGCPPIERAAVSVPDYMQAREHATKAYANKRLRPSPMGSLDLKFLSDSEALANIERLKESGRVAVPSGESLMMGIMDDEMDLGIAQTTDDKDIAEKAKSSKIWRLLRLSVKTKLARFDKFKDGENVNALFESPDAPTGTPQPTEGTESTSQPPEDGAGQDTTTKQTSFVGDGAQDEVIKDIPVANESQDVTDNSQPDVSQPEAKPEPGSLAPPEENTNDAPNPLASSAASRDNLTEETAAT